MVADPIYYKIRTKLGSNKLKNRQKEGGEIVVYGNTLTGTVFNCIVQN